MIKDVEINEREFDLLDYSSEDLIDSILFSDEEKEPLELFEK